MTYRDELETAHRRIEQLEGELVAEREKKAPVPAPALQVEAVPRWGWLATARTWWPVPTAIASAIAYPIAFRFAPPTWETPLRWFVLSTFLGSLFYAGDVALRRRSPAGERTLPGRILVVLAVLAGTPALTLLFVAGATALSYAIPIGMAVVGLIALVRWIVKGKAE